MTTEFTPTASIRLPIGARVLVTGATGLIGRTVLALLDDSVQVFAVCRGARASNDKTTWLRGDLAHSGSAREIIRTVKPHIVIHLAGAVQGERKLDAVGPTLMTNLVGTVELLEAATRADVSRIVVSGSLLEEPVSGDAFPIPPSPYGASRWASSAYARMFHALFDTPVTILRPSYAYGPGQDGTKLLPHVITTLLQGKGPELASGERQIDFIFAEDVGRAFVAAAVAPGVHGETIDIGTGEVTRVRDVVAAVVDLLGPDAPQAVFGVVPNRPLEQEIHVNPEIAARLLGWRASISLEEGLRRTVAWHRDHPRSGNASQDR